MMSRVGRVYIGPEPDSGPHPGYRGPIRIDQVGVHLTPDCEHLLIGEGTHDGLAEGTWEPMWTFTQKDMLIPWHRVDMVEFEADV